MSSEKFCLRWNDFESNISSAFRELREDKDFFDVTLACDDDQIQAHKVTYEYPSHELVWLEGRFGTLATIHYSFS